MTKLLVIDDDHTVRVNLVELLEAEDFEVLSAKDGRQGVEIARQSLPDLIICDIMMPELDGYGVLAELRQDSAAATIPFIFLTALADRSDLRQGMNLGADDYLVKPFARSELLTAIESRLAKHAVFSQKLQARLDDLRNSITLALPHELRTPLTGILGFSEFLAEDAALLPLEEVQNMGRSIYHSAQRLHDLILNFLLYAELAVARGEPKAANSMRNAGPSDIALVIAEVAEQQAWRDQRADDLELDVEPADVRMGAAYLAKLLKEIIQNAFKFSRPGTPVALRGRRQPTGYTVSIEDHGRGMTAAQIADVGAYLQFERQRYEQQGQGLGLIIAKWLAELHAGQLTIDSVYGESTTVHISLPLVT
jgi:two-component system sensor histidine kinase/response regulator